jgi:hypothetical protein
MTEFKKTYIFRFRGYEAKFVQRRGESYIDYEQMYFNEQKEFTESELNDFVANCYKNESKRKLLDWIELKES